MNYPIFFAIEASSPDEDAYPVAIAWSTPEGTIKSTLICPDDDWEPWYNVDADLDVQQLFDQGATASEIMREINDDVSGTTVFFKHSFIEPEAMLTKLSESAASEPDFELADWSQIFSKEQLAEYPLLEQELIHQTEGAPNSTEDQVKLLLLAYDALNKAGI